MESGLSNQIACVEPNSPSTSDVNLSKLFNHLCKCLNLHSRNNYSVTSWGTVVVRIKLVDSLKLLEQCWLTISCK